MYPNHFRVSSQVKLYHSFKQGWREGSITSDNMRFRTLQFASNQPNNTHNAWMQTEATAAISPAMSKLWRRQKIFDIIVKT